MQDCTAASPHNHLCEVKTNMNCPDKKKFRLLPRYGYMPLILIIVMHMTVYLGTKLINRSFLHHDLTTVIDRLIPLTPEWVLIYVLAFLFWGAGLISASWQERELCFKLYTAAGISYLICAVCFVVLPTEIIRPEICATDFCSRLVAATYAFDVPTNIFPSMHCMMSYIIFRGVTVSPMYKKPYSVGAGILTLLISVSTLFVKQHYLPDVISGLVFGEISFQLGMRTRAWLVLDALDKKLLH